MDELERANEALHRDIAALYGVPGQDPSEVDQLKQTLGEIHGAMSRHPADRESLEAALATIAAWLIPYEIVFPPVAPDKFSILESVRSRLGEKAQGTGSSVINAFGLHLNVEVPDYEVDTILSYLRAFMVLFEELKQAHEIDPVRNMSGFISPFGRAYRNLVLNESYQPDLPTFIDDYLSHNPTRNRPLDLLPLFLFLDSERVRSALPEEKISARPALHYRLLRDLVNQLMRLLSSDNGCKSHHNRL